MKLEKKTKILQDEPRQTNQNSENQDSRIFSKKSLFGKREKELKGEQEISINCASRSDTISKLENLNTTERISLIKEKITKKWNE